MFTNSLVFFGSYIDIFFYTKSTDHKNACLNINWIFSRFLQETLRNFRISRSWKSNQYPQTHITQNGQNRRKLIFRSAESRLLDWCRSEISEKSNNSGQDSKTPIRVFKYFSEIFDQHLLKWHKRMKSVLKEYSCFF